MSNAIDQRSDCSGSSNILEVAEAASTQDSCSVNWEDGLQQKPSEFDSQSAREEVNLTAYRSIPDGAEAFSHKQDPSSLHVHASFGEDVNVLHMQDTVTSFKGHLKRTFSVYQGSAVSFHDIHYEVEVMDSPCQKQPKKILEGVSGIFRSGTVNAIMGPTGCGKSSLLDILAGRKSKQGLAGLVLIDGQPQPENFKLMSGYVVQDDVIIGELSVRENLMFSANLRLPQSVKTSEKVVRVDQVIEELGLLKCADTKVGNAFTRGVSGGERKRTNIGMELVTSPRVLFLDEPTTGLDANTAKAVITILQRLAEAGSTIIFSIHQPRFSIYKLCNTLLLLGNGETVYFGPALQGMDFFNTLGYVIEEHDNPADFYLDVINGDSLQYQSTPSLVSSSINVQTIKIVNGEHVITMVDFSSEMDRESRGPSKKRTRQFAEAFKSSKWNSRFQPELDTILREYFDSQSLSPERGKDKILPLQYHTSFGSQLGVVCGRTMKVVLRNPRTSYLQVFTMCLLAVVTGGIYFNLKPSCDAGLQNRVGAFFFIIMNLVFGNLSAVDLFILERTLFIHENVSGFYRVSSYFLSKIICDVIPNRTVPVIAFCSITYWMIGFDPVAEKFFFYVLNMIMTTLAACGLSFAISASVRHYALASLLIGLCYVIMMVFSGLLVNIKDMGDWFRWLQWLSIFRYSLKALSINELKDMSFYTSFNGTQVFVSECTGNTYLTKQGIDYDTKWDLWQNELAMGAMAIGLLTLTYVQLRRAVMTR